MAINGIKRRCRLQVSQEFMRITAQAPARGERLNRDRKVTQRQTRAPEANSSSCEEVSDGAYRVCRGESSEKVLRPANDRQ